ncbi:hypothetical protein ALC60_09850 [Trachymyrmex zeteki]|uniref:Uncharacterized protein n=1 Tax=Mycetomoellerius zeteki TaxID=64791 RepID=A0A151WT94_9HYME|nr:hypothetical protein ALC60_09850 [Trachymyrmex zeteki]
MRRRHRALPRFPTWRASCFLEGSALFCREVVRNFLERSPLILDYFFRETRDVKLHVKPIARITIGYEELAQQSAGMHNALGDECKLPLLSAEKLARYKLRHLGESRRDGNGEIAEIFPALRWHFLRLGFTCDAWLYKFHEGEVPNPALEFPNSNAKSPHLIYGRSNYEVK